MIYKEPTIYKIGGGSNGGGANINKILSENCFLAFVSKMSGDVKILNYDARLDNELYKVNDLFEKVDGIKNIGVSKIDLGIASDNLDIFISFWINSHSNYFSILSNKYIDDDTNNFGIYTGSTSGELICLVDTKFSGSTSRTYQNGSGLEISNIISKNFCKDVFYPFTNIKSGVTGNENISNIGIFPDTPGQVTIFNLAIIKYGVLVMDLVPCVRKSDGVAGFINKIDNSFIYNQNQPEMLVGVKLF